MWHRRNKVWALIDKMVQSGFSVEVAINRIEQVYGSEVSITTLIQKIMTNKDGYPNLSDLTIAREILVLGLNPIFFYGRTENH